MMMKKKKNKKKLGPQEVEANQNTAGVVQEIAPQNATNGSVNVQAEQNNMTTSGANDQNGSSTLKIIEPTNIETVVQEPSVPEDNTEDNSDTEIFQL